MALLLSYIENMLPFRTGIPGIKLGIANLIIVIAFYFLPFGEVLSISLLRVFFLSVFQRQSLHCRFQPYRRDSKLSCHVYFFTAEILSLPPESASSAA